MKKIGDFVDCQEKDTALLRVLEKMGSCKKIIRESEENI